MAENIVGKHTLESLTKGMYADPFTIYREYIQNSADSIDCAIRDGILKEQEDLIDVIINKDLSFISIKDNGTGIHSNCAQKILGDIGNSEKNYKESRGFRGIGRLAGLAYAKEISFITSSKGDPLKTKITYDGNKLRELLQPGRYREYDVLSVLREVTSKFVLEEDSDAHYFEVILKGIFPEFNDLLDNEKVQYYLSNVAPVAFDWQRFIYAKIIKEGFWDQFKKRISEYQVRLNKSPQPLMKKYKSNFKTGQQERTNQDDDITNIEFFSGERDGEIIYGGWLGICNFKGTIKDDYMRGIRIRKGNILVGDETTFGQFFSSEQNRANGVFIGEVHIFWDEIIPNSQRNDFEKTSEFIYLKESLTKKADELNKKYRRGKSVYNSAVKKITDSLAKIESVSAELSCGVTSQIHREKLLKDIKTAEIGYNESLKELEKCSLRATEQSEKEKINELLSKKMEDASKFVQVESDVINSAFSGKNDLSHLSKEQRRIYIKIVEIIDKTLDSTLAKDLILKIKEGLK